jgi:glycosyltransferase involved in cell wall biosynthesis
VLELDLDGEPLAPPQIGADEIAYIVLRRGGRFVGRLIVDGSSAPGPDELLARAGAAAAGAAEPLRHGPIPRAGELSVVIATRNRPADLRACLAALSRQEAAPLEIVVADSASDDPVAVESVAREAGARLVRCERRGLSLARNAGAAAARGSILAFLDDDCRVDAGWLAGLLRGFEDEGVGVVTGSFAPLELETEAQRLFLEYAHMDRRGAVPHRFSRGVPMSRHWPLDAWRMGSGGNIAVRAEAFRSIGGFRLDLGLGTPAHGGEDLFLLWSAIRGGRDVVYRADAMAWHRHHRGLPSLRRVMFGYGAGHAAYLRAAVRAGASRRQAAVYAASVWYDRLKRLARAVGRGQVARAALVLREGAGLIAGRRLGRRAEREIR